MSDHDGKRPRSFLRDGEVQDLVKAEVLPPAARWSREATEEAKALERYAPVLERIVGGEGLSQAARACRVSKSSVLNALYRHPAVYDELKRRRDVLRELVHARALARMHEKLDGSDISARDLTDLARATKPRADDTGEKVELILDN